MNAREEKFCEEYMVDLNATAAAIRAGYTPRTAQNALQWITEGSGREKPSLRARVNELRAKQSKRTGITADRVLRELAAVAFADLSGLVDADGGIDRESDPQSARAISSIRVSSGDGGTSTEIRMADKNKALELLGKHLGLFTDQVNVSVSQMPQIIANPDGSVEIGKG